MLQRLSVQRGTVVTPAVVRVVMRVSVLALCFVLAVIRGGHDYVYLWLVGLTGSSAVLLVPGSPKVLRTVVRFLEAPTTGLGVLVTGGPNSPLLAFVVVPAFGAGVDVGIRSAVTATGLTALALLSGQIADLGTQPTTDFVATASQWVVLSLLVGLVGAWIRRTIGERTTEGTYAEAHHLLEQLRGVTRALPIGLDPVAVADRLLSVLNEVAPYDVGVVFVRSGGTRLAALTTRGARSVDWTVDLSEDTPFAEAWVGQQPTFVNMRLDRHARSGSAVVLPMLMGRRTFGLVALESNANGAFARDLAPAMMRPVHDTVVRLDSALLFEEIRNVATTEERQRLAREIHDGIAQELVYLGYSVDNATYDARDGRPVEDQLRALRQEITRIISELRLSIFDLRSDVTSHGGLGAALADYARAVARGEEFSVHLTLDEAPSRLPVEAEEELLRIGQEAITNVRKHAHAQNLWLTLQVDPPHALLQVADDGVGLPAATRERSYGRMIMQERATRMRAKLEVLPREPRGTVVEVRLGPPPARPKEPIPESVQAPTGNERWAT